MLLLVGASVRALLESAAESGFEATGIDFYGDVDAGWQGRIMCVPAACGRKPTVKDMLQIAKTISCEGLVYASGPENVPQELEYWEKQGLLRGNGPSVLAKVRNPWVLRRSLERIGAKMPCFCSWEQWREDGKRWLWKPLNRGGGHGIMELSAAKEGVSALIGGLPNSSQYIVQEYKEGLAGSATFLTDGEEAVVLGTSLQLSAKGGAARPFFYAGNIVPLDLQGAMAPQAFAKEITRIVAHLVEEFGLKGLNTLDFIVNQEGIWVLELNPRWSASVELIERSLGQRLFAWHLATCEGEKVAKIIEQLRSLPSAVWTGVPHFPAVKAYFWGKRIVYAHVSNVTVQREEKELRFLYEQGVRDIPRAGTRIEKGQPLCTVLAEGFTAQDCSQKLELKAEWAKKVLLQAGGGCSP